MLRRFMGVKHSSALYLLRLPLVGILLVGLKMLKKDFFSHLNIVLHRKAVQILHTHTHKARQGLVLVKEAKRQQMPPQKHDTKLKLRFFFFFPHKK